MGHGSGKQRQFSLECVDNALHFDDLQQLIHQYAAVAEMHVSKLVLDLQDQWAGQAQTVSGVCFYERNILLCLYALGQNPLRDRHWALFSL